MTSYTKAAAVMAAGLLASGCTTLPEPVTPPPPAYVRSFSDSPLDAEVPRGWRPWRVSRFKKATHYRLVEREGRLVVRASAESSASALAHPLRVDPAAYPLISWQWNVHGLVAGADNTRRDTEDSPARIIVTFDGDMEKLPLDERILAANFHLLTGETMPYATLMYIWENRARENTIIPNRNTSRVRMIVVRSGSGGLGTWQHITRNVAEDFRRAFGEEPGPITAIAIMTDTDNTGGTASADYGDIVLQRAPEISRAR